MGFARADDELAARRRTGSVAAAAGRVGTGAGPTGLLAAPGGNGAGEAVVDSAVTGRS